MFVSEKLVFLELHKTGCSHIGKWLRELIPGEQIGKHNPAPPDLWDRFLLGSVRNPWDWYVSLWAYGCSGQGAVRARTTATTDLAYVRNQLFAEMGLSRFRVDIAARQLAHNVGKPWRAWLATYDDPSSPEAFRSWLRMMMDPERRFDIGEGYGFSPVSRWAGLMTYRYLRLFSDYGSRLYSAKRLGHSETARADFPEHRLVHFVVRNENLEDDLIEGLVRAGLPLTESDQQRLREARTKKTNTSKRRAAAYYFDTDTAELVARRERLIIERHGYRPPVPTTIPD